MNTSEAVQVFVLIYVLVMAALYFSSRYWSPLISKLTRTLGLSAGAAAPAEPTSPTGDGLFLPPSFRPAPPRPPRLRPPPPLGRDDPEGRRAYRHRLGLSARLVGFVAAANPTGFPVGLYREWHGERWLTCCDDPALDAEVELAAAIGSASVDEPAYASALTEFAAAASYAEMADVVHFCGEAFAAAKAGSEAHARIIALSEALAVALPTDSADSAAMDDQDRLLLERKLEVDFRSKDDDKVAHLRRMHAFFRGRLMGLRDDPAAERRAERMADCRRHMEEHERLLRCLGVSP